ncbi:MAG TPA: V-type ATP synthase subunit F [Spirochaetota bacterium]|nr:V-type ATP synthase subunit F [Spirochaetota bacterium]HPR47323.1 V-type ATP synthase subunit F [Spirochaetota bacterium]
MEKIYIIGDIHTVTAFRLGGVEGAVSSTATVRDELDAVMRTGKAGIILITRELADAAEDMIERCNLEIARPIIVEIPGINDRRGFGKSIMSYITEALGISVEGDKKT